MTAAKCNRYRPRTLGFRMLGLDSLYPKPGPTASIARYQRLRASVYLFLRAVAGEGAARWYDWRSVALGAHDAAMSEAALALHLARGIEPMPITSRSTFPGTGARLEGGPRPAESRQGAMANTDSRPRPPPGYEAQGGEIDGWWTPEQGAPIRGVLLGREWHEQNGSHFYRLRLLDGPVQATATGREAVTLTSGQVLGVGERFNLRALREWSGSGRAEVWICPTSKVQTRGGQSVWRFELATKGPKVASKPDAHDAAEPWEQDPNEGMP